MVAPIRMERIVPFGTFQAMGSERRLDSGQDRGASVCTEHRGIVVPDPVLASAEIHKAAIYFADNGAGGASGGPGPSGLRSIVIHDVQFRARGHCSSKI